METKTPGPPTPIRAPEAETAQPRPLFEPPTPPRKPSPIRRRLSALGAAIVALLAKLKTILVLLPKLKLLASTGTILVSLAAYALLWGWPFAAGFIALLFVHEMGHVIALRREGLKASAPML